MANEVEANVLRVPIGDVAEAAWNPKPDGTPAERAKLAASIKRDRSAGVLAVRRIAGGRFEVIDGNHRLQALRDIGVTDVDVEDFGAIGKNEAILISARRNHQWYEPDETTFADMIADFATPDEMDEYVDFVPDALLKMADSEATDPVYPDGHKVIVTMDPETWHQWEGWRSRVADETGDETDEEAFRLALQIALQSAPWNEG